MIEFQTMQEINNHLRQLAGLYEQEKKRADELSRRVDELEEENCKLRASARY